MGYYKYLTETFVKEWKEKSPEYRERLVAWRKEPPIVRVERPLNISRARILGYKAKKGFVVVRVRIAKGNRKISRPVRGRKPSRSGRFFSAQLSDQAIAEQRANRKYRNLEVLNSYWVGDDGTSKYYEVILVDPARKEVEVLAKNRNGRAFRGLTSAGRKARGLRFKGKRRPKQ
ncbi:MAG: 50S ribosomal protein L15e [Candidatus Micrarchaeia archaeon]